MTWHPDIPHEYRNAIVTGDARELAQRIPDESVDLLLTDPPYGIGYKSNRPAWRHGNRKPRTFGKDKLDTSWLKEMYRVLKPNTPAFVFTRWDVLHHWKDAAEKAGFVVAQRLVWDKSHWTMGDLRYYGAQTEDVLFLRKGAPVMYWSKRTGDVFKTTSKAYYPEGSFQHPTQKPQALAELWIEHTTPIGAVVLDPFCGSGTTAAAAVAMRRNFIAFEIDPDTAEAARQRVRDTQPPLPLDMPTQEILL